MTSKQILDVDIIIALARMKLARTNRFKLKRSIHSGSEDAMAYHPRHLEGLGAFGFFLCHLRCRGCGIGGGMGIMESEKEKVMK